METVITKVGIGATVITRILPTRNGNAVWNAACSFFVCDTDPTYKEWKPGETDFEITMRFKGHGSYLQGMETQHHKMLR